MLFALFLGGQQEVCAEESAKAGVSSTPVGVSDKLKLSDPSGKNFKRCDKTGSGDAFTQRVTNESTAGIFKDGTYRIEWGDGTVAANLSFTAVSDTSHKYQNRGVYILKFSAELIETNVREESIDTVINLGSPGVGLGVTDDKTSCTGSEMIFVVLGYDKNTNATTYELDYGDGVTEVIGNDKLKKSNGEVSHLYSTSPTSLNCRFLFSAKAKNECFSSDPKMALHAVVEPPKAEFEVDDIVCTGASVVFTNKSSAGKDENCDKDAARYEWDFGDSTTSELRSPVHIYADSGTYTVSLIARFDAECSISIVEHEIKVITTAVADFEIDDDAICAGEIITFTNNSEGDQLTYITEYPPEMGITQIPGTGKDVKLRFDSCGLFYTVLKAKNVCSGDSVEFEDILVSKDPEVTLDSLHPICQDETLDITAKLVKYNWYCNGKAAKWEVISPGGVIERVDGLYPQLTFKTYGIHTVKVILAGTGCHQNEVIAERKILVYDTTLVRDITVDNDEICAGGTVNFTSRSAGQDLTYKWTIPLIYGSDFTNGTKENSASPSVNFPMFSPRDAPYVVRVHLQTACKKWDKEFPILVKKDPEVTLVLDPAICPGVTDFAGEPALGIRQKVKYEWYNSDTIVNWSVTTIDGEALFDSQQNATKPYPKIDFKKAGEYTISVSVKTAGCSGDKLSDTKALRVWNDSVTLDVTMKGSNSICEGGVVSFTNSSSAFEMDQLIYKWDITPDTGWSSIAGALTDKEPTFEFSHYGTYVVTSAIATKCNDKHTSFSVLVRKDPKVTFDLVSDICLLDTLELDTNFVRYEWYNNAHKVIWQIDGGAYTFLDGTNLNSLHPKLLFEKGTYTATVSLVPSLSGQPCGDVFPVISRSFTVNDTTISGDVKIIGGRSDQDKDMCEGEVLSFENTTSGVGLTYQWNVVSITGVADSCLFVEGTDLNSKAARIQFKRYGEYKVELLIAGTCNSRIKTFNIKVRGVPEVDFKPLADICNHTTLEITPEKIGYVPKDCDLTYNWSLSPADGYSFDPVKSNTTAHPAIAFTTHRPYQVTLELTGQCGGPREYPQPINVLNTNLEALSSSSVAEGCTDLAINFGNTSVGDALTYHWSITPATDWEFTTGDAASETPSIKITKDGNYVVTLAIENICGNHTSQPLPIRAYSVPVIKADGIQGVCEKDFMFIGNDRITIDENNDPVTSVQWTVTPVGFTWTNGETEHSQKPDITFKNGTYQLKGEYRNACPTAGVVEITVVVDSFIPIAPSLIDLKYCHYDPKDLLRAAPEPGVWSSASPGMVENDGGTDYYFNPRQWGDFEVIYHYTHLSCIARDTINVHVDPLPEVYAGPDQEICINNDPRALMETSGIIPVPNPASWWEGRGEADDIFTPDVFGARPLYYWYLEPATGCRNVDSLTMMVWGLPDTTFRANAQYCVLTDAHFTPVELGVGNRFDWTFGDGHSDTTYDAVGVHRYEDFGYVGVSMIATSVHGCKDTSGVTTVEIVNTPPPAVFTLDSDKGCGPHELNISLDSMAYTDKNLLFTWNFGNGVLSDSLMPPNPQTYEAGVWDTTYVIHFGVYNLACADRPVMDKEITVYSSPDAQFVAMHKWECSPMDVKLKNNSTGNKSTYVWHFGDGESSLDFNPTHLFTTDTITRVFNIMLIATNQCDVDTSFYPLIVKPQTLTAFFQTPKRDICVGEEICFTNHSSDSSLYIINKQWNFGDNSGDTTWNACHAYDGDGHYQVHLFIDNGCGFDTISDYIIVHPLPVLTIQSEDYLCENDTFHFEMSSDLALQRQEWDLGDSTISINRFVQHRYKGHGFRTVKVQGISSSIGFCKGAAEKVVEIYPNPVITILPLDTVACGEMLYKPDISGVGFLMWDYGDGSDLTSATEHFYENPTDEVIYRNLAVYAESDKKCKSDYKGLITLYNVPRAGIDRKILKQGKPQQVEFINLSEMYDDCVWHLPFNKIVHSFDNQVMEFDRNGYYEASVVAANRYGCSDSASIVHQVLMKGLFFPNTFIPHSESQAVNRFNGVALGLKEYHLMILDPYGNKVWETNELENGAPVGGWDGCNVDGKQMPQGVYIWRARALFLDEEVWTGKNNDSGAEQTVQGTVMLLRK